MQRFAAANFTPIFIQNIFSNIAFNIFLTKKYLSDVYLFNAFPIKKLILLAIENLFYHIYFTKTYPFSTYSTSTDLYNAYFLHQQEW